MGKVFRFQISVFRLGLMKRKPSALSLVNGHWSRVQHDGDTSMMKQKMAFSKNAHISLIWRWGVRAGSFTETSLLVKMQRKCNGVMAKISLSEKFSLTKFFRLVKLCRFGVKLEGGVGC